MVVGSKHDAEQIAQCDLVRDIFGPFRFHSVDVNPAIRAWQNFTIPMLATTIYEERAFDRLPIVGDALEEAGCQDSDILDHCRQPGGHVAGCWVIDLILGNK